MTSLTNQNISYSTKQNQILLSEKDLDLIEKKSCKAKFFSFLRLVPIITLLVLTLLSIIIAIVYSQVALAAIGSIGVMCAIIIFYQIFTSSSLQVVSTLKKCVDYLGNANHNLKYTNQDLKEKLLCLEEQIKSLDLISQNFSSLKSLFSDNNQEFKSNLSILEEKIKSLGEITQNSSEIQTIIKESQSLLKELLSWGSSKNREEMRELRLEILSSINLLKEEKTLLIQSNSQLEFSINQNVVVLSQLKTQIEYLKSQISQLSSLLESLTAHLNEITTTKKSLNETYLELSKTKEELQNIVKNLQEKIKD